VTSADKQKKIFLLRKKMNKPETGQFWTSFTLWVITGAAFVVTVYAFYPGYMGFDAAYQYWQVRNGSLTTQHPPFMVFIWMLTNSFIPGPGGMLVLNLVLYWLALKLIADALFIGVWPRVLLILILGFWPYNLLLIPNILKDVCMMAGLMMATAGMLQYQKTRKPAWLVTVVLFSVYASLMRHNAIFGALVLFFFVARSLNGAGFLRSAMAFITLCAATVSLNLMITELPIVKRQVVWPTLVLWDLAHISVREDVLLLPEFTVGPGMTTLELKSALNQWTNATLFSDTKSGINNGLYEAFSKEQYHALLKAWVLAIARYPASYLEHRAELSAGLYGRPDMKVYFC